MARIVVVGAGFAGHTAALYLGDKLGRKHSVTVVNRSDRFVYIPSLVWVGIDRMDVEKTASPCTTSTQNSMLILCTAGSTRFIPMNSTSAV